APAQVAEGGRYFGVAPRQRRLPVAVALLALDEGAADQDDAVPLDESERLGSPDSRREQGEEEKNRQEAHDDLHEQAGGSSGGQGASSGMRPSDPAGGHFVIVHHARRTTTRYPPGGKGRSRQGGEGARREDRSGQRVCHLANRADPVGKQLTPGFAST